LLGYPLYLESTSEERALSKPPKIDRPKLDRKNLKNPDEFVKRGTAIVDLVARQRSWILPTLAGIAFLIMAGFVYEWWQGQQNEKSWFAFYEAEKQPEAQKWDSLKKVYETHPKYRAGLFAATQVADHYFELAKTTALASKDPAVVPAEAAQATEWYTKAIEWKGLIPLEKQLLHLNRGNSFELQKKYDEAMKDFEKAADGGGDLKGLALLQTAQVWELKGDTGKATELYTKVSSDFANGDYAKMAKNYLRRLKNPVLKEQKL
jgi:tetratricopeptide (TPR) repeat protein